MKTILLLNDTTDHDNWGSVAGAEALKTIIRDAVPVGTDEDPRRGQLLDMTSEVNLIRASLTAGR